MSYETTQVIKIFLAEDHLLVRKGLRLVLEEEEDFKVVGEASDSAGLFQNLGTSSPDIAIVDFTLPGTETLDLLTNLKRLFPSIPVLALSMHPEDRFATMAFKAGVAGYLTKDTSPEIIIIAIRKIAREQAYVTPWITKELAMNLETRRLEALHAVLSGVELQIMRALAAGKRIREIAIELSISAQTVSGRMSRIMEKMNMKTVSELKMYAINNRLVE